MATAIHRPPTVAVLGAGPAGAALATALGELGATVLLVGREERLRFSASYGVFVDDRAESLADAWEGSPRVPVFLFSDGHRRALEKPYVRLNSERLAELYERRLETNAVQRRVAEVTRVRATARGSLVEFADGESFEAALVIDARGAGASPATPPTAYQTALGLWLETPETLLDPGEGWLMDFRAVPGHSPGTFLYAMGGDRGGHLFVQETVLADRNPADFDVLEEKLLARLAAHGVTITRVVERERCLIPLGVPTASAPERVFFGAAAGFAQPASGYQLTHALRVAPRLAKTIAEVLGAPRDERFARAREAVWTEDERSARFRYELGLEVLLALTPAEREDFLRTFVEGPGPAVADYLEGVAPRPVVDRLMWRQFLRTDTRTKGKLVAFGARYSAQKFNAFLNES